jgi:hypothetical protein
MLPDRTVQVDARRLQDGWDAERDGVAFVRLRRRIRALNAMRPAGEPSLLVGTAIVLSGWALIVLVAIALGAA